MMISKDVESVFAENDRRLKAINTTFNPYTGQGSIGDRTLLHIPDFPIVNQYVPVQMMNIPLVKKIVADGSINDFIEKSIGLEADDDNRYKVISQLTRLRCRYDFPFWAALYVYIKNKGGGNDTLFRLTRPQRKFVSVLEQSRLAGKPIRIVLLKARQWGGSTTSQLYMAWLQLMHRIGLNSLIIAHQSKASDEIKSMFDRMIKAYPIEMLYDLGEAYSPGEKKLVGVGMSGAIHRVPQRNCNIKIGSAESPDSCRGGDYSLVHLSEVGLWKKTDGKSPEDIVRSACSGVLLKPYTMIVYESTANGSGNFFQTEYDAAKRGESQFQALFISWFDIDIYSLDFESEDAKIRFADRLYRLRNSDDVPSTRTVSGRYLWKLWEMGATLEALNWYVQERAKYNDQAQMAAEYPSDDIEAFVHSGQMVFDGSKVDRFKAACKPPRYVGEVVGKEDQGDNVLADLRFEQEECGKLWVWRLPDMPQPGEAFYNRYLCVVDIGGRSAKADWSVIVVFDRLRMAEGGKPSVVAQWYGHIDIDLLAWKAAQIAAFYCNALLVIESNTLETHDRERIVDGDQSAFILNRLRGVYPNIYARKQSPEDIRNRVPVKYGFHTNVATKPMIISMLVRVVREQLYVERDIRCLEEMLVYERKPNGAFGAVIGRHDDLLMTRAIGLHVCYNEMPMPAVIRTDTRRAPAIRPVSEAAF